MSTKTRTGRRPRISLLRILILSCLAVGISARAFAATPLTLDLALNGLKEAQPPHLVDDVLILSYKPTHPLSVPFVGARFDTENYAMLHPFSINQYGVYVLDYVVPEHTTAVRYRLVVDGLYVNDPNDSESEMDDQGNLISLFPIDKELPRRIVNPQREADGSVRFVFRGPPGRRVAIQGDFNNWDPFVSQLTETEPGTYSITLRLLPGAHWYRFYTDGRRVLDQYNSDTARDPEGQPVSYFEVFPPSMDPG